MNQGLPGISPSRNRIRIRERNTMHAGHPQVLPSADLPSQWGDENQTIACEIAARVDFDEAALLQSVHLARRSGGEDIHRSALFDLLLKRARRSEIKSHQDSRIGPRER